MPYRILIAAPDDAIAESWNGFLSELACETKVVNKPQGMFHMLGSFAPDLVVLEAKLSGFDVCRKLKDARDTNRNKILLIAELTEIGDVERAVAAGSDDFVSQPVDRLELLQRAANLLRLKDMEDERR